MTYTRQARNGKSPCTYSNVRERVGLDIRMDYRKPNFFILYRRASTPMPSFFAALV